MNRKLFVSILMTVFIVSTLITFFPVKADPDTIKVGIFGPMRLIQGVGLLEGAQIAKEYIDANPIMIGGTPYTYDLVPVDSALGEVAPEPTTMSGGLAMEWLLDEDVDLIYGGFRSEAVLAARELAMDEYKIWCICGAATNELIDCGDGTCGACVRCDYDRYKYIFRNAPTNVTTLLTNMAYFCQYYLLPVLAFQCGEPGPPCNGSVRTAVLAETGTWCDGLWNAFINYPSLILGPNAYMDVGVCARVAPDATNVNAELTAMDSADVRLIITLLSGDVGRTFELAHAALGINAVPFGINVLAQMSEWWDITGGSCEYEFLLASSGTRTPISTTSEPYTTTEFWDLYEAHGPVTVDTWDIFWPAHAPICTAWGIYEALIQLKGILEAAGVSPPFNSQAKSDALVPYFEAVDSEGVLGRFKYTTYHDVYSPDTGPTWPIGYTRVMVTQWQAGELEVVWPLDQPYSQKFWLPSWMPNLRSITDIEPYKTVVGQGLTSRINVTVSYYGPPGHPEDSVTVSVYYDDELIGWASISQVFLEMLGSVTFTFTWNTIGVAKGSYNISATADNIYVDGVVNVGMPGDIDLDGWITIADVSKSAMAFGSSPGHLDWFPNGDFDDDDFITIADVSFVAGRFGEHDP